MASAAKRSVGCLRISALRALKLFGGPTQPRIQSSAVVLIRGPDLPFSKIRRLAVSLANVHA